MPNTDVLSNVEIMAGRLALVMCSDWGDHPALSYLPEAARRLARSLTSPKHGQCDPALPDGRALLVNPTAHELDDAIRTAFARASELEATLILAFTGHGITVGDDYYLLAKDSPEEPDSRTAFLAGQRIKEFFRRYGRVDGLVLLLDTCESGNAADAAGRDWINIVRATERRFEVLTATGDEPAYGGCFTRALDYLILTGSATALDRLGCVDVHGPVNELCTQQRAVHVAVNGAGAAAADVSMWLALNAADDNRRTALYGTPAAGVAAQLIRFFQPTRSFQQVRDRLRAGHSVGVVGPAGCGKTALVVALTRPGVTPRIHGIWLGEPQHTVEQAVDGLAEQLTRTVAEFNEATVTYQHQVPGEDWRVADAVERRLVGPLRALTGPVWIVVDNANEEIDQRLVHRLVAVEHVRVVCTASRSADLPEGVDAVPVQPADPNELAEFGARRGLNAAGVAEMVRLSAGNWLTAALLTDALHRDPVPSSAPTTGLAGFYTAATDRALNSTMVSDSQVSAVLAVLAAAGAGPVLPGSLLLRAAERLGGPSQMWHLHEVIALLPQLTVHGRARDGKELFGLLYPTIAQFLWDRGLGGLEPETVHAVLADVTREAVPVHHRPDDSAESDYAVRAEAEHLWRGGRHRDAIDALRARQSWMYADNRERWAEWHRRIAAELSPVDPLAFEVAALHASAVAETGEHQVALRLLRELVEDAGTELGATHQVSLGVAQELAFWIGETGDAERAKQLLADLVLDLTTYCGALDPLTLTARHHHALMFAKTDDSATALAMWEEILVLRERVIGPLHIDTLRTRQNILYWKAEKAYPPPVAAAFADLARTLRDTVGEFHPEVLTVRYHSTLFLAKTGYEDAIKQALRDFADLLPDMERIFGVNSRWTGHVRDQLQFWPQYLREHFG